MKEKDPNKIPAIFQATLELVGEVGLTGLKMANIAKKAQLASGTLYLYFSSKEDLLNALYRHLKSQHSYLSAASEQDLGQPLKVQLKKMWAESLRFRLAHFNESVFVEQFYYSPYLTAESREVSNQVMQYLLQVLEAGKRDQLIKDLDNALLLCLLSGFLKETVAHCKANRLEISPELIDASFMLCWDALKA
ncbi:MAG TPA: TetR/AcrR family transcriptional regulator [Candidatus Obscuribacterales bacterium]